MIKEAIVKIVNKEDLTYDADRHPRRRMRLSLLHCQPKAPEQRRQMKLPDVRLP